VPLSVEAVGSRCFWFSCRISRSFTGLRRQSAQVGGILANASSYRLQYRTYSTPYNPGRTTHRERPPLHSIHTVISSTPAALQSPETRGHEKNHCAATDPRQPVPVTANCPDQQARSRQLAPPHIDLAPTIEESEQFNNQDSSSPSIPFDYTPSDPIPIPSRTRSPSQPTTPLTARIGTKRLLPIRLLHPPLETALTRLSERRGPVPKKRNLTTTSSNSHLLLNPAHQQYHRTCAPVKIHKLTHLRHPSLQLCLLHQFPQPITSAPMPAAHH